MGARFNGDGLVNDVALDAGGRGQANFQAAHATDHTAIHDDIVGHDLTADGGGFADGQQMGADVAFDRAFDLNVAGRLQVADHCQIRGENRSIRLGLHGRAAKIHGGLGCGKLGRFCLVPFNLLGTGFIDSAFRKHCWLP